MYNGALRKLRFARPTTAEDVASRHARLCHRGLDKIRPTRALDTLGAYPRCPQGEGIYRSRGAMRKHAIYKHARDFLPEQGL